MSVADFYDALAPFYHLNYADWNASVTRQARALDTIIQACGISRPCTVLDAACGIGTQSLGLAELGYSVTGSDLSSEAVARAGQEAARRNLPIEFSVADMRSVAEHHARAFDVVLACDNSVPHLLSDEEILMAFRQFFRCTAPGGICLISVRDYALETREGVQVRPPVLHTADGIRRMLFQVWEFDGPIYNVGLYLVEDRFTEEPTIQVIRSRYYAVTLDVLTRLIREAGFQDVQRFDEPFYQPVLVGRKPQ